MRVALYARVSTFDQDPENQVAELRKYAAAMLDDHTRVRGPRSQRKPRIETGPGPTHG
jgi:DNA invertase Pin-like site-specific DNA recombinase